MGRAIGIDLGTTNSCVAVYSGSGEPQVIPAPDGPRTTPSVVAITDDGGRLVGQSARRQAVTNPRRTISSAKRLMGARFAEVSADDLPYEVSEGPGGSVRIGTGEQELSPEQVSAMILAKLRADAATWLEDEVTDAVITVPAYFSDAQRQATKDAGTIAGLNVLRIINEPTAAALAYGLDRLDDEQTVLVFDLGGGTFDVSVLELGDGVFDVKATAGDNKLGGDDFDRVIVRWMLEQMEAEHGVSLEGDPQVQQRLAEAAEKAKLELSGLPETEISLPFLAQSADGAPLHFSARLSRSRLETMSEELLERLMGPTRQVLEDAQLEAGDIDHLLLVGGMTRMPAVQERVRQIIGKEPTRSVNPDEVVALGAAIQAEVLAGDVRDVLLLDVTPLSLGIETRGGIFTRLIERNTTIPTRRAETFTTAEDNQPSVDVHVLQGEREMASDNRSIGRLQLLGIPPAPRGVPQIEVSFELDANGILSVSAIDLGTGNTTAVRMMEGGSGLDEETLKGMIDDATRHQELDQRHRQVAELRNRADGLIYSAEQALTTYDERISATIRDTVLDAVGELRAALAADADPADLERACAAVVAASHDAADQVYRSAAPDLTPDPATPIESFVDAVTDEDDDAEADEAAPAARAAVPD